MNRGGKAASFSGEGFVEGCGFSFKEADDLELLMQVKSPFHLM